MTQVAPKWAVAGPGRLASFHDGSLGAGPGPLRAVTDGSLGFLMTSPLVDAAKAAMKGLGTTEADGFQKNAPLTHERLDSGDYRTCTTLSPGMSLFRVVASGIFAYHIGKAVAPSAAKEKKYAMWAVPIGLLSPYLGLGCMAMYAMKKGK